ncbi:hypothetical protein Metok_1550 [Methanothermococcus okinawensis IH1]|uniref:Uncharacterized protein n=1 Tax=Methanothermococcus okinawensis (strain DSM 14208 / JCM 11175 / IH1) TaxID=647113 RepID=F8AKI6_METOI|nr:hypothetical protein Metok_1550 [Methanothermococcus okinawensis IH1]
MLILNILNSKNILSLLIIIFRVTPLYIIMLILKLSLSKIIFYIFVIALLYLSCNMMIIGILYWLYSYDINLMISITIGIVLFLSFNLYRILYNMHQIDNISHIIDMRYCKKIVYK